MNNYNKSNSEIQESIQELIKDLQTIIDCLEKKETKELKKEILVQSVIMLRKSLENILILSKKRKNRCKKLLREDEWLIYALRRDNCNNTNVKLSKVFKVSDNTIGNSLKSISDEEKQILNNINSFNNPDGNNILCYNSIGNFDYIKNEVHKCFNLYQQHKPYSFFNVADIIELISKETEKKKKDTSYIDLSGFDLLETEDTATSDYEEFKFELEEDDNEEGKTLMD